MKRLLLLPATAFALVALAGTAAADTVVEIKDGTLSAVNDDTGIANEYTIWVEGDRVHIREPKDPKGIQGPLQCNGSELNSGGVATHLDCPKSEVKQIVVEPGPAEDSIEYKLADTPLSVAGATGADKVNASEAADDLSGEQGNDTLNGAGGDDILAGDEGSDILDGGAGNDKITGGTGTDTMTGGAGDDTVFAADGLTEKIDCGEGNDTITADAQDELTGCEGVTRQNITGVAPDDTSNDKTRPTVDIGGSERQKASTSVRFVATCSEKGIIQAIGFLDAAGINDAMKPSEAKVDVGGGGTVLKLKFLKRHMRNIRADLRKKRRVRVRITVSCVDGAGNTSRARKFWIYLRR